MKLIINPLLNPIVKELRQSYNFEIGDIIEVRGNPSTIKISNRIIVTQDPEYLVEVREVGSDVTGVIIDEC